MNLPNKITLFRVCLIPVFLLFALGLPFGVGNQFFEVYGTYIAAAIFIIASISDFADGYIARKQNLVTNFGKFMDPIADKILVVSAMLVLVKQDVFSALGVIIIVAREFMVSAIRMMAASGDGKVIAADKVGKVKTVFQMLAVIFALLRDFPFSVVLKSFHVYDVLFWISVILTIWSGVDYLIKNRQYLRG